MKRAPGPTLPPNPSLREDDFVTLREDISREVARLPISSLPRFGRLAVSLARGLRFGLLSVLAQLDARANWNRIERDHLDEATTIRPLAHSEAS